MVRKAKSKDVRTEAISYLIRNRNVLNTELDFSATIDRKFNSSVAPRHNLSNSEVSLKV